MEQSIKSVLVKQTIAHQQQQLTNLQVRDLLRCSFCLTLPNKVEFFLHLEPEHSPEACPEPGESTSVSTVKLKYTVLSPLKKCPLLTCINCPQSSFSCWGEIFSPVGCVNVSWITRSQRICCRFHLQLTFKVVPTVTVYPCPVSSAWREGTPLPHVTNSADPFLSPSPRCPASLTEKFSWLLLLMLEGLCTGRTLNSHLNLPSFGDFLNRYHCLLFKVRNPKITALGSWIFLMKCHCGCACHIKQLWPFRAVHVSEWLI